MGSRGPMRIALFVACFNDAVYPETGRAVVTVLERLGHEVVFPADQTCCGQMHLNAGYRREALVLARRFVDVFSPYETIVAPSASCVGTVVRRLRRPRRRLWRDLAGRGRPPKWRGGCTSSASSSSTFSG